MAGTVVLGGTQSAITSEPTTQRDTTEIVSIEEGEYDAKTGLNTDAEAFQEITLYVGEFARIHTMDYRSAIVILMEKLKAMLHQPIDGSVRQGEFQV